MPPVTTTSMLTRLSQRRDFAGRRPQQTAWTSAARCRVQRGEDGGGRGLARRPDQPRQPMMSKTVAALTTHTALRGITVAEVMHTQPKLRDSTATAGDLRALFADGHVHAALIVDQHVLLTVIDRSDLPTPRTVAPDAVEPADAWSALALGTLTGRCVLDTTGLDTAHRIMTATHRRRLAVVDANRRCVGLLCLKRNGTGFCSDHDVAARRRDHRGLHRRDS
jgi:CBS domain-containing protein